jgi:hypothetical protein
MQLGSLKLPPSVLALWAPVMMVNKRTARCFRFLFLNLIFGLLGVYVLLLVPVFFADHTLHAQFEASLKAGAFFTFTIAFLSSTALLLLESQPRAPSAVAVLKPTLGLIALALVAFSAIGAAMQAWLEATHATAPASAYKFQQILFYLGVAVSFYCFLVAIYEEELDDFAASDNQRRTQLARDSTSADSDGRGMAV